MDDVEPVVGSRQNGLISVKQSALSRYNMHQSKPSSVSSNPMGDYVTAGGLHSSRGPNALAPMAVNRHNAPGSVIMNKHKAYSRELSNVKMTINKTTTSHGLRNSS